MQYDPARCRERERHGRALACRIGRPEKSEDKFKA
jgi:hypothetical protein